LGSAGGASVQAALVGVEPLELLEPPALVPLDPALAPALLLDPPPGLPAPPEFVPPEIDPPAGVPPATDPPEDELDDDEPPPGLEVSLLPPFEPPLLELPLEPALELLPLEPPPDPEELLVLGAGLQPMTEPNRMAARAAYREKPEQGWCIWNSDAAGGCIARVLQTSGGRTAGTLRR
jgi:hypothetical protein